MGLEQRSRGEVFRSMKVQAGRQQTGIDLQTRSCTVKHTHHINGRTHMDTPIRS